LFELDPITDLLTCFALGLGASILGVISLLVKGRRVNNVGYLLPLTLSVLLAAPAVALATTGKGYYSLPPLVALSTFFGLLTVARTPIVEVLVRFTVQLLRRGLVASMCLSFLGLGLFGWQVASLNHGLTREMEFPIATPTVPGSKGIEPIPGWVLWTDRGRSVQMMRAIDDPEAVALTDAAYVHSLGLDFKVIQTAPSDLSYNCHGWVFGDGKAWISGESVDSILEDNQYQSTTDPAVGDVVVFRDSSRKVSHTALIRAIMDDGTILVESKWGGMGRYRHTLDNNAYKSHEATFYTSSRAGHRLHTSRVVADAVGRE